MACASSHGPMVDALCKQFLDCAARIYAAVTPQESFPAVANTDKLYERALNGLRLASKFDITAVLGTLGAQRQSNHDDVARRYGSTSDKDGGLAGTCKKSASEIIFLEGALQVITEVLPEYLMAPEYLPFCDTTLQLSFHWLSYNWAVGNEAGGSVAAEVVRTRSHLLETCGRVVTIQAKSRMKQVVDVFVKTLSDRVNPKKESKPNFDNLRLQIQRLCSSGMSGLKLRFENDVCIQEATDMVNRCWPRNYVAPVKKSQTQHIIAEMLTQVLWPLVWQDQPHSSQGVADEEALGSWYKVMLKYKKDAWAWMNEHAKHLQAALPLYTTLVCLLDDNNYAASVDETREYLVKMLKGKDNRNLCVKCLVQLACSYLNRYGKAMPRQEICKWLDKVVAPILVVAKKGVLSREEQLEMVAPLAELAPEYTVNSILVDMLNCEAIECVQTALRALYAMLACPAAVGAKETTLGSEGSSWVDYSAAALPAPSLSSNDPSGLSGQTGGAAPLKSVSGSHLSGSYRGLPAHNARVSGSGVSTSGTGVSGSRSALGDMAAAIRRGQHVRVSRAVLALLRSGAHPFDVLGISSTLPQVNKALGRLLSLWHLNLSSDKVETMACLIRLIPLTAASRADGWPGHHRALDVLHSYTTHSEASIRSVAWESLTLLMRSSPSHRNAVLVGHASHLSNLTEEQTQFLREGLMQLRTLIALWCSVLVDRAEGECTEQFLNMKGGEPLDVDRMEGFAFATLCHHDEVARKEALQLLHQIRELHVLVCEVQASELQLQVQTSAAASDKNNVSAPHGPSPTAGSVQSANTGVGMVGSSSRPGHAVISPFIKVAASRGPGSPSIDPRTTPTSVMLDSAASIPGLGSVSIAGLHSSQGVKHVEVNVPARSYLIELIEESGPDIVRECYWDFGDWPDWFREHNQTPEASTPFSVLLTTRAEKLETAEFHRMRLLRCLVQLSKLVGKLCPSSGHAAHKELSARLSRMVCKDAGGRPLLMQDYLEPSKMDAWRYTSAVALSLPPTPSQLTSSLSATSTPVGRRHQPVTSSAHVLLTRDLIRVHVALVCGVAAGSSGGATTGESSTSGGGSSSASATTQSPLSYLQLSSTLALGHAHSDLLEMVLEELSPLMDEYIRGPAVKQKTALLNSAINFLTAPVTGGGNSEAEDGRAAYLKVLELRRLVGHVMRILAGAVPSSILGSKKQLAARLLEWLRETHSYFRSLPFSSDHFWEVPQVAYCLSSVVRSVAVPLLPQMAGLTVLGTASKTAAAATGPVPLRKGLWDTMSLWGEEGYDSAREYRAAQLSGINGVVSKLMRDTEGGGCEHIRHELQQSAVCINNVSRQALGSLLAGPAVDNDARKLQGPVLSWLYKLFKAGGEAAGGVAGMAPRSEGTPMFRAVGRYEVARIALLHMLQANPELLTPCIDRCYDRDNRVARGFFQVVCEVYATNPGLPNAPSHVLLSLVLYKMVDPVLDVREDALHMLHVLTNRHWGHDQGEAAAAAPAAGTSLSSLFEAAALSAPLVLVGHLQDAYLNFQLVVSSKFASEHKELSEAVCEEMMTRQLDCGDPIIQRPVLSSLVPWMENLSMDPRSWQGTWSERLLKVMYYVTLRHGHLLPDAIGSLWSTLASDPAHYNIQTTLEFLFVMGIETAQQDLASLEQFLEVSKRITLYLARVATRGNPTIDLLVAEIGREILEFDHSALQTADALEDPSSSTILFSSTSLVAEPQLVFDRSHPHIPQHQHSHHASLIMLPPPPLNALAINQQRVSVDATGDRNGGDGSVRTPAAAAGNASALDSHALVARVSSERSDDTVVSTVSVSSGMGGRNAGEVAVAAGGRQLGTVSHPPLEESQSSMQKAYKLSVGGMSSGAKSLITRPELALCLLSEVAFDHGQVLVEGLGEVRPLSQAVQPGVRRSQVQQQLPAGRTALPPVSHLPLLLHSCLLCVDVEESVVGRHAQQLLLHLLYSSLSLEEGVGSGEEEGGKAYSLIRYLLSMRGSRLWHRDASEGCDLDLRGPHGVSGQKAEGTALLQGMVQNMAESLSHPEGQLQIAWSNTAFGWALYCRNLHFSCRSFQVYRALSPTLTGDGVYCLLSALYRSFSTAPSGDAGLSSPHRTSALSLIETITSQLKVLPSSKLLLYPQLYWMCISLLHTRSMRLYTASLQLLLVLLEKIQLEKTTVQHLLLAAAPSAAQAHGTPLIFPHMTHSPSLLAAVEAGEEPEPWELGALILGILDPSTSSMATPRPSVMNIITGGGGARTAAEYEVATGAIGSSSNSVSCMRACRHQCLAVQQMLLKGLSVPSISTASAAGVSASVTQLLTLQALTALLTFIARHGSSSSAKLGIIPNSRPWQQLQLGYSHNSDNGATTAVSGSRPRQQHHDVAPVLDQMGSDATTQSLGMSGRPRAGAVASIDSDTEAAAEALLGAPPSHYDSLRRHVAMSVDGFRAVLGPWRSQLMVSLMGVLPPFIEMVTESGPYPSSSSSVDGSRNSGVHQARSTPAAAAAVQPADIRRPDPALCAALEGTLVALSSAAEAMGMLALSRHVLQLAEWRLAGWRRQAGGLESQLRGTLTEVRSCFFPAYSEMYLHHCLDLLASSASSSTAAASSSRHQGVAQPSSKSVVKLQSTALLLIRCMFEGAVELLPLNSRPPHDQTQQQQPAASPAAAPYLPGAAGLLAREATLLSPVISLLSSSALSTSAHEAVAALLSYGKASGVPEAARLYQAWLQQEKQRVQEEEEGMRREGRAFSVSELPPHKIPSTTAAAAANAAAAADKRNLAAASSAHRTLGLPPCSVAAFLRQVLDSLPLGSAAEALKAARQYSQEAGSVGGSTDVMLPFLPVTAIIDNTAEV
ncbi:hypothetical protein CEUSTIGMA_g5139.t1 [Chlamydomonas eustigma]|uniref:Uncharacterized protein n=1 Tax=Chlamydomonas eustigma TaxID=1157962 RepID=A0A250X3R1_9CHLO|nr:hypothetical protein CEUSTIGMA_g5139.t1 [Chlamydomonas eustigma]|eukprot:GAX77696.1 hypothetical protein CEUSTIGMA_g5139.t1 [Chlamydomonas eustigma]